MSIQSVDRALSILTLFSSAKTHLGITEIANALGLTNSTIHGLVKTLNQNGFLEQDKESKKYSLGVRNFELGHFYLSTSKVYQIGAAAVHRLVENTGLTARIAVRDGDFIVVLLTVYPKAERFQYYQIGPKVPLYCTGMGKAILPWLQEEEINEYINNCSFKSYTPHTITDPLILVQSLKNAKTDRYVIDKEEMLKNTFCIASPVFNQSNRPVAALSLSSGAGLLEHDNFHKFVEELIHTAAEISYSMGSKNLML